MTFKEFDYTEGDNCGNDWKLWLRSFERFMDACKIFDSKDKKRYLLHYVGEKVQIIYDSLTNVVSKTISVGNAFLGNEPVLPAKAAFEKLKSALSNKMTLGYWDPKDKTILITDASPVGLGAVLIQTNENGPRVISYAAKSLSEVERRYAQTEKEALGLVWACERFYYYLLGRPFELHTDHKPLEVYLYIEVL